MKEDSFLTVTLICQTLKVKISFIEYCSNILCTYCIKVALYEFLNREKKSHDLFCLKRMFYRNSLISMIILVIVAVPLKAANTFGNSLLEEELTQFCMCYI